MCLVSVGAFSHSTAKASDDVKITKYYEAMVVGQTVKITSNVLGDVKWSTNNPQYATIDEKGNLTALKKGVVKVTVEDENGKKDTAKVLIVGKQGTTFNQTNVNKMLASSKVKTITIKNEKSEESYEIKKGTYSKKELIVNAPYSDVTNYGSFKKVVIMDVKNGTWNEGGERNKITVNDNDLTFSILEGTTVKFLNMNGETININNLGRIIKASVNTKMTLNIEGSGAINTLDINNDSTITISESSIVSTLNLNAKQVTITANGKAGTIYVTSPSNITLTGDASKINIVVMKEAAGTTIASSVPVHVIAEGKTDVNLKAGAEGSTLLSNNKEDAVIDNNTTKDVKYIVGPETFIIPPKGSTSSTNGESGGADTTTGKAVKTVNGNKVTYKLPRNISELKTVTVTLNAVSSTQTFDISKTVMNYVYGLLGKDTSYISKWKLDIGFTVEKGGMTITLEEPEGLSRKVTFKKGDFEYKGIVTLNESDNSVQVKRADGTGYSYILSKEGYDTLIIISDNPDISTLVDFTVTY